MPIPSLILHGGAGRLENLAALTHGKRQTMADSLGRIAEEAFRVLRGEGARAAVLHALAALEDDPLFNAGTGARLQADGQVRLSAALMDGTQGLFSGVMNVQAVRHPSDLAARLAREPHHVLGGEQATAWARAQGIAPHDPVTPERRAEHEARLRGRTGTVGAVAVDAQGRLCAGTSTGGVGGETPGRISDAATVAGTYASSGAGVSCTGVGEEIVNLAAAARVVTRVADALPLAEAVARTMAEATAQDAHFGLIALDAEGRMAIGITPGVEVLSAQHDGTRVTTFLGGDAGA